jgi:hypothetical protein
MKFFPGNPVQIYAWIVGIFLSLIGFFVGCLVSGLRRLATTVVSASTAFLWLLLAIATAAV